MDDREKRVRDLLDTIRLSSSVEDDVDAVIAYGKEQRRDGAREDASEYLLETARDLEDASLHAEADPADVGTCGWAYRMAASRLRARAAELRKETA